MATSGSSHTTFGTSNIKYYILNINIIRHLQLFILADLGRLGPTQLKVLGHLLSDGRLFADLLHLLLALHVVAVGVGLCLSRPPVVEMSVVGQSYNTESNRLR